MLRHPSHMHYRPCQVLPRRYKICYSLKYSSTLTTKCFQYATEPTLNELAFIPLRLQPRKPVSMNIHAIISSVFLTFTKFCILLNRTIHSTFLHDIQAQRRITHCKIVNSLFVFLLLLDSFYYSLYINLLKSSDFVPFLRI